MEPKDADRQRRLIVLGGSCAAVSGGSTLMLLQRGNVTALWFGLGGVAVGIAVGILIYVLKR